MSADVLDCRSQGTTPAVSCPEAPFFPANHALDEDMTMSKARSTLKHAIFGCPHCIRARDILLFADEVERARSFARTDPEGLPGRRRRHISMMTFDDLEAELERWRWLGWNGEDFEW